LAAITIAAAAAAVAITATRGVAEFLELVYFLSRDGILPRSNEGRLRCPDTAIFFFHSTTVPLASALAKKVVSTCHAAAVMPALMQTVNKGQNRRA
jgi:hypothetical protein